MWGYGDDNDGCTCHDIGGNLGGPCRVHPLERRPTPELSPEGKKARDKLRADLAVVDVSAPALLSYALTRIVELTKENKAMADAKTSFEMQVENAKTTMIVFNTCDEICKALEDHDFRRAHGLQLLVSSATENGEMFNRLMKLIRSGAWMNRS
jgi:hypothetical protein